MTSAGPETGQQIDILIDGAAVVTVDPSDRVIENGAIAITGNRITAIGSAEELAPLKHRAARVIPGCGMAALPGFVDTHAHAGHALTRALGRNSDEWMEIAGRIFSRGTDPNFWAIEAGVSALERIRCGTTTACLLFGGGPDVMRVDDAASADAHLKVSQELGIREVLAVGPCRPPWPSTFVDRTARPPEERAVSVDHQFEVMSELIEGWHGAAGNPIQMAVSCPVFFEHDLENRDLAQAVTEAVGHTAALAAHRGLLLVQDGHRNGSIARCATLWGR